MINQLVNLFYPKVCAGCDSLLLQHEFVICTHCRHSLPLTHQHLTPENEAFKKFYGKVPVEFAATFLYYHKKGMVQQLIHHLKYKGFEDIGGAIGSWYGFELQTLPVMSTIDAVIPVPLHQKRLKERGYNQVTQFGRSLAMALNVTYDEQLLYRNLYSKTQTKKNLLARTEVGQKTIFDVHFSPESHNKHFLLVDDVLTTGSTLEACSRALLTIPNSRVSIVCMAMSHT